MKESLSLVRKIAESGVKTFHEHHHILFDLAKDFGAREINYVEIGCYAGASASLMMHRPKTSIISIDLGKPIPPAEAILNVNKFNAFHNRHNYVCGNSTNPATIKEFLPLLMGKGIDLLFIDGGHKYDNVILDFLLYSALVNRGGYVVIDDVMSPPCPEVYPAVQFLELHAFREYTVLGIANNEDGALFANPLIPTLIEKNNEFVLRKK